MSAPCYEPQRAARSSMHDVRGLSYHVLEWGDDDAPLLFMVHGWMDVAASFQFLVDALVGRWHVVAPDWRGYGLTEWAGQPSYWLPDYLADLECLLDRFSPGKPVRLVGHSMGGNIATIYAGVRPERIRTLVNLEGLGLTGDAADKAPARLARWLDELRSAPSLRPYASIEAVVARLRQTNPRLSPDKALYLAGHWAARGADGQYRLRADPAHKIINPYLYRADETAALYAAITAPVLWVMARDSPFAKKMEAVPGYAARIAQIARVEQIWVDAAGHMLHHDQPATLAAMIEDFLGRTADDAPDGRSVTGVK